jgi:hypothetical protein
MPVPALRASLAVAAAAVALAVPAVPSSGESPSPFHIQDVHVTVDPSDKFHPIVSFRLVCNLPPDSPLRSGQTETTQINLEQNQIQPDYDSPRWILNDTGIPTPWPYTCGTTASFLLSRPGAGAATLQKGVAHVTIRDVIDIGGGTTVQVLYDRDVMIPHPNG